jgi:hypothetical protein
MDRVLERLVGVQQNQLQLLAAACLSLAAKSRVEEEEGRTVLSLAAKSRVEEEDRAVLSLRTLVLYADNSFCLAELKV